jgi:hypothetical protein
MSGPSFPLVPPRSRFSVPFLFHVGPHAAEERLSFPQEPLVLILREARPRKVIVGGYNDWRDSDLGERMFKKTIKIGGHKNPDEAIWSEVRE